jgi:hypothetical protein
MNGEFVIYFQSNDTEEEKIEIQNQCEHLKADLVFLINNALGGGSVASSGLYRGVYFEYTCGVNDPANVLNKVGMAVARYNWLDRMHQHAVM